MQATYGYTNFIDAILKIWNEDGPKSKVIEKIEVKINPRLTFIGSIAQRMSKIKRFYAGAFYYALAYTVFIALEFALHDSLLE